MAANEDVVEPKGPGPFSLGSARDSQVVSESFSQEHGRRFGNSEGPF